VKINSGIAGHNCGEGTALNGLAPAPSWRMVPRKLTKEFV